MSSTRLAYLSPDNNDGGGDMIFIPEREGHRYRLGEYGPSGLEDGFYNIDFNVSRGSKGIRRYSIYYLNKAEKTTPPNTEVLFSLVEEMTGFADDILARISLEEPIEEILPRITDKSWLQEIEGIGDYYAESLVEKFSKFTPGKIEVYSAFEQYGIPYTPGNQQERWANLYYSQYQEELKAFRKNPYHLLTIADSSREKVRQADKNSGARRRGFDLQWLDNILLENDADRWEKSRERCIAYLKEAAKEQYETGHTVITPKQLGQEMRSMGLRHYQKLNGDEWEIVHVTAEEVDSLVENTAQLTRAGYVDTESKTHNKGITTPRLEQNADTIANQMYLLNSQDVPFGELPANNMRRIAKGTVPFDLDSAQSNAIDYAFSNCVTAITGPAGSGKTTVLQCILNGAAKLLYEKETNILSSRSETQTAMNIYVTAPTGKATRRIERGLRVRDPMDGEIIDPQPVEHDEMPQATNSLARGNLRVGTLHSFLGYKGSYWEYPDPHPSFIVVDESSMMNQETAWALCYYISTCQEHDIPVMLLLTGDVEQLEPVGPGYPFRDLLGTVSGAMIPSTELKTVHRQGKSSGIIESSHYILNGETPPDGISIADRSGIKTDIYWHDYPNLPDDEPIDLWRYIESVTKRANYYTDNKDVQPEDVQLILPLRNQSSIDPQALHTKNANVVLQEIFAERRNVPIESFEATLIDGPSFMFSQYFAVGDTVVHTGRNGYVTTNEESANHRPVMRGSVGEIVEVDPERGVRVRYPHTEMPAAYTMPEEIGQLKLAYAITGHMAQGSEFDVVAVVLPKEAAPPLMSRSWLYTAMTRASEFLDLMATPDRVQECATKNMGAKRQTLLSVKDAQQFVT